MKTLLLFLLMFAIMFAAYAAAPTRPVERKLAK